MTRRTIAICLALSAGPTTAAGCSTTYDDSLDTVVSIAPTTTVPTGTAAELLPRLADEAAALPAVMIAEGDATAALSRITVLWDAVRDEVARDRPDLLAAFDANVAGSASAVKFRRAADADKAATNLATLVTAYSG